MLLKLSVLLVLQYVTCITSAASLTGAANAVTCSAVSIGNCALCDKPPMDCNTCLPGPYIMNSDYSGCTECPANCAVCAWDTGASASTTVPVCSVCSSGYVMAADNSCQACSTNCAQCHWADSSQTSTVCDTCRFIPGITLGAISRLCLTCPDKCLTCAERGWDVNHIDTYLKCSVCEDGYYAYGTVCAACSGNCVKCSSDDSTYRYCTQCKSGFVVNAAVPSADCLVCPSSCSKCSGQPVTPSNGHSQCTTCSNGYYLDKTSLECLTCPFGCATCANDSLCLTCNSNYVMRGELCASCSLAGCDTCTQDTSKCLACMSGYTLIGGVCQACSYQCSKCTFDANNAETCTVCAVGWGEQASAQTSCAACPDNCKECTSPTVCIACNDNYILNSLGTCTSCGNNCEKCTISAGVTTCTQCQTGYVKGTDDLCYACDANCLSLSDCSYDTVNLRPVCSNCLPTFYRNSVGACIACNKKNCDVCTSNPNTCTACTVGYYLTVTSTCTQCTLYKCLRCISATVCTLCSDGYYVDSSNQCSRCGSNCQHCLSPTNCISCVAGAVPSATAGACVTCDAHCSTLPTLAANCDSTGSCSTCLAGWYAAYATCHACPDNCQTCSSNSVCTVCNNNYVLERGRCFECQSTCENCQYTVSSPMYTTCSLCSEGSLLAAVDNQCHDCPTGCATCYWTDGNAQTDMTCDHCKPGFGALGTKCLPCPYQCDSCSVDEAGLAMACDDCLVGFVLNTGSCGECPPNCLDCYNLKTGSMTCKQCAAGFIITSAGQCAACPSQCTSCTFTTQVVCLPGSCNAGYGLSADKTECLACSFLFPNCVTCSDVQPSTGETICTQCSSGYVLTATSCVYADVTNCQTPGAREYECQTLSCIAPFTWITSGPSKGFCGLNCAVCGDIDSGKFYPASTCQSSSDAYSQSMTTDGCWVARKVVDGITVYARGGTKQFNCTSAYTSETVLSSGMSVVCCTSGNNCNADMILDGVAGASLMTMSAILLLASIFLPAALH